ncbi:hypothetical protein A2W14_02290 [Candidatus Gottesmanbacteria bacterium RBG_16_37_8]|uniref:Major facilitator superfamily (MFS) profile domain-containing protein n=1 Tax=Candidatus Gottesmanbacteria bacterium RBG_16_37_8 TaxID=1798371 RepID=A0A1F5YRL5_9BACT|nr:MAG: hypothetical protein A2W14_02290 [Candidatus Gottesmanbacteria bacterium RBG_16_37_8]
MFKKIPKNVLVLGIVSLFNDIASEMIYPVVPIFLTAVLNVPVSIVGIIEGIAEATASLGKFIFGYLSDKAGKRKIFVEGGYGLSSLSKLLMALASSWIFVLLARFIDRLGKGLRTGARDALLLESAHKGNRGFIFGLHRSLDSAGAVIGPFLAFLLLYFFNDNLRLIFFLAFIPSVIGVFLLVFFVKEKRNTENPGPRKNEIRLRFHDLNPSFKLFFIISLIFALGNSSDAFLILRAKNLGLLTQTAVLTYVLYNIFQTFFATPLGRLSDRVGAKKVYTAGLLIFSAVYFSFAVIKSSFWIWFLFPLYGLYIAATEGVSKAYISEFIDSSQSATYFGMYQTGIALCSFIASLVAGFLWNFISPASAFYYGSFMAFLAFVFLLYGKLTNRV